MKSIKRMMPADATVVKDGVDIQVPVCELVVGDVVVLMELRLIESMKSR